MNGTELRLGNFIYVDGITEDHVNMVNGISIRLVNVELLIGPQKLSECLPIPITPEWLKRFGFKPDCNEIQFNLNQFMFENKNNLFYIGQESFKIQYIHQLQNLYFALTGLTLMIKDAGNKPNHR